MRNFRNNEAFVNSIKMGMEAFRKRGPHDPIFRFFDNVSASVNLVHFVDNKSKDNKIKRSANKNYIINLVTSLEIYFKDVLRLIPGFKKIKKNNFSGIEELLKERSVTLESAYVLFRKNMKIKVGDVLAAGYTLESLDTIDNVFSKALGLKAKDKNLFISKIKGYKPNYKKWKHFQDFFKTKNFCLDSEVPHWRSALEDLFKKRHEYVHDICLDDELTYKELSKYWWALMYFIYAADMFIRDKYL